jgi:hypothetical protein
MQQCQSFAAGVNGFYLSLKLEYISHEFCIRFIRQPTYDLQNEKMKLCNDHKKHFSIHPSIPYFASMTQRELFLRHNAQTSEAPLCFEVSKAEGVMLYDAVGKRHIDIMVMKR